MRLFVRLEYEKKSTPDAEFISFTFLSRACRLWGNAKISAQSKGARFFASQKNVTL